MTFNIFTGEHKHKLTRGERAEWTQYLWPLLNASAMTASARLARHIEFRVRWNGVWNLRSAFFASRRTSSLIPLIWRVAHSINWCYTITPFSELPIAGMGRGPWFGGVVGVERRGRRRSRGCTSESYLPGRFSLWFFFFFFLTILPLKLDSSHYGWLGSSLH